MTAEPEHLPAPRPLRSAAAVVVAEGVALVGVAVWVALAPVHHADGNVAVALGEGGAALFAAAVLVLAGRALGRAARWARSPVVLTQLLALPVGVSLLQAGLLPAGAAVVVPAVVVLGLVLLSPEARAPYER